MPWHFHARTDGILRDTIPYLTRLFPPSTFKKLEMWVECLEVVVSCVFLQTDFQANLVPRFKISGNDISSQAWLGDRLQGLKFVPVLERRAQLKFGMFSKWKVACKRLWLSHKTLVRDMLFLKQFERRLGSVWVFIASWMSVRIRDQRWANHETVLRLLWSPLPFQRSEGNSWIIFFTDYLRVNSPVSIPTSAGWGNIVFAIVPKILVTYESSRLADITSVHGVLYLLGNRL